MKIQLGLNPELDLASPICRRNVKNLPSEEVIVLCTPKGQEQELSARMFREIVTLEPQDKIPK